MFSMIWNNMVYDPKAISCDYMSINKLSFIPTDKMGIQYRNQFKQTGGTMSATILRSLVIVLCISFCSVLCGIDYYVGIPTTAPGTGSSQNPYESIEYALTQLPANEYCTLVFMPGIYDNDDTHYVNRQLKLRSSSSVPGDVVVSESFMFVSLNYPVNTIELEGITFKGNNNNWTQIHESALLIDNCVFEDYANTTPLNFDWDLVNASIRNSVFRNNDIGISDMNGNWLSRGAVQNCLFYANRVALSINGALLENCTITDNSVANEGRFGANTYRNSIIWGNQTLNTGLPSVYYYCDTQSAVSGADNISVNPRFDDPSNEIYTLKWDIDGPSPCIDAGDPNSSPDPDGTPRDIGFQYYPHELETYSFDNSPERGIFWRCFPVVDNVSAPLGTAWNELGYMFQDHMALNPTRQLEDIYWSYNGYADRMYHDQLDQWYNDTYTVTAPKGFKLYFDPYQQPDDLIISGFRADPTIVPVEWYVGGVGGYFSNWVGYFVPQTQNAAFSFSGLIPNGGGASYLDYIYSIKTQTWSTSRQARVLGSRWIVNPSGFTFSEGTMIILELIDGAPSEMFWTYFGSPVNAYTRSTPTQFSYTEKLDYTPLYVELDPSNLPDEIGVYAGDKCIGAVVVDNEVMDINLYLDDAKTDDELQIAFYYAAKGKPELQIYEVYDPALSSFVPANLQLGNLGVYAYISMKEDSQGSTSPIPIILEQNYPNPFNPTTQISFYLGSDLPVKLDIFNVKGQKVNSLCTANLKAGKHSYLWNGDDQAGRTVSSGIYFYRLSTPEGVISNKMILMK